MSPWPQEGTHVPEITVQQLAERLKGDHRPFLLDVRQPWENDKAAIAGTDLLVPLHRIQAEMQQVSERVGADDAIVVYCHHGMRSQVATAALLRAGFKNVASLAGGIDAWSALVDPSVPRY